ncbi:sugar phosphate isomerase/epimerase [Candidatus Bathyarchaeota archaeon]|nr:sugar phosphate isomerase/epimerase [Candidatus Bathyarchaeota archaeon]MBS7613083.1 sugar phosphate isomerase/epimerase [Candidatus Bathyarchaeota archaeon]MBS7618589.1 sugar phosphate isomerase/epimerase [Candidatus Bathyarchaeota archaeon]
MKLSFVYVLPVKTEFKYAIKDELPEVLNLAAEFGFKGVEYNIPNPFEVDFERLLRLTEDYGLRISAISTGSAYLEYGLTITHPDFSIREKALKFMRKYIEHASAHNSGVVVGLIRGRRNDRAVEEIAESLISSIKMLEDHCLNYNVFLLIEPLNRYETDYINNVEEALRIVEQTGNYVKLLLDTFHMNIEERNIRDAILRAGRNIGHVHIAENNRLPPGLGSIGWKNVVHHLYRVGFNGYLSLEALPRPSFKEALKQTAETLNPIIKGFQVEYDHSS